jgi:hypothetical protein
MQRGTLALGVALLFGGAEFNSPRLRGAEPILIPEAFATQSEPMPKSWRGREFKVTIESTPTGEGGAPQLRVAQSSGDRRADRIALSYALLILQVKPDLRRQNANNMLTFPMVLDGGLPAGAPRKAMQKHASLNKPKGGFKDRTASRFESVK